MPGIEHDVHPLTRKDTTKKRWCFNRPDWKKGFWAKDGIEVDVISRTAVQKIKWSPFRMSNECRYDEAINDSQCQGCFRQNEGAEYNKFVREKGKA